MPHPHCHSFRVEKPFRIYRRIGDSPSNTYVGRSMAFNPIYEARNVQPGDEIHVLPGGTYQVEKATGKTWSIDLKAPKHIFEKTYGFSETPEEALDRRAERSGDVVRVTEPETTPDWKSAKEAMIMFKEMRRMVAEIDQSPEFDELLSAIKEGRRTLADIRADGVTDANGNKAAELMHDHTNDLLVRYEVFFGNYINGANGKEAAVPSITVEWLFIPRTVRLQVNEGVPVPPACGAGKPAYGGRTIYQMDLETLAAVLPDVVASHVDDVCAKMARPIAPR